jgi:hypothetical protein
MKQEILYLDNVLALESSLLVKSLVLYSSCSCLIVLIEKFNFPGIKLNSTYNFLLTCLFLWIRKF